jgi:hypothetical protein
MSAMDSLRDVWKRITGRPNEVVQFKCDILTFGIMINVASGFDYFWDKDVGFFNGDQEKFDRFMLAQLYTAKAHLEKIDEVRKRTTFEENDRDIEVMFSKTLQDMETLVTKYVVEKDK